MRSYQTRKGFWREAVALQGSITVHVLPSILFFGLLGSIVCAVAWFTQHMFDPSFTLDIRPLGFAGAVLGILLVIRLNAGYDRWWEARTKWGGIVNQSRNLVISAMAYGPHDSEWRENVVRWTAVFPYVAHLSLRSEQPSAETGNLIGIERANELAEANHMPSLVALRLAELLQDATERFAMDGFAFMQIDRERALLIDHIGACERILATPLPRIYSITIRRFILLFLLILPIALLHISDTVWLIPVITMLVAYPLLTLDQIGVELENPFSEDNLSHLPLDDISANIERNLFAMSELKPTKAP
ncbi:Bestrophin, RFP-TM, chloride channel [Posidoniimonas corsicana]|uniref:Bestrophin, RFP-TM, chloride channel n=1 Tax=Posidoniimonas corsicana TaxID=1938618 RepID=A0A5C5V5Q5_9BACT|nr:bestrophin family ion channel [Posidoniimonas corsicana]TWT33866.1 Bestrophin, RFP-TM, chloride channel [Posidoniimonas corsicana]